MKLVMLYIYIFYCQQIPQQRPKPHYPLLPCLPHSAPSKLISSVEEVQWIGIRADILADGIRGYIKRALVLDL